MFVDDAQEGWCCFDPKMDNLPNVRLDAAKTIAKFVALKVMKLAFDVICKCLITVPLALVGLYLCYQLWAPPIDHVIPFVTTYEPCDPLTTQENPRIVRCSFLTSTIDLERDQRLTASHDVYVNYEASISVENEENHNQMIIACITFISGEEMAKKESCRSVTVDPRLSKHERHLLSFYFGKPSDSAERLEVILKSPLVQVYEARVETRSNSGWISRLVFNNGFPRLTAIFLYVVLTMVFTWAWIAHDLIMGIVEAGKRAC